MSTNVMGLSRSRIVLALAIAVMAFAFTGAQAQVITYNASLNGPSEDPPSPSAGIGTATVEIDPVSHTIHIITDFSGLTGMTTVAHIHAPTPDPMSGTADVAVPMVGFPVSVTSGQYDMVLFLNQDNTYDTAFLAAHGNSASGAEAALLQALAEGRAYINIHSDIYPNGEIRGFLSNSVPVETTTWGKVKSLYR